MVSGKDHPIATVECGEWGDEYPSIRLVGPSLDRKAEAYMDRIGYGKIPEDEARANAILISAAPELLEVCKLAVFNETKADDLRNSGMVDNVDIKALRAIASAARAAIAKAEGRT